MKSIVQAISRRIWNGVLELRYFITKWRYDALTRQYVELRHERNRIRNLVRIEREAVKVAPIIEVQVLLGKRRVGWAVIPENASPEELLRYTIMHVSKDHRDRIKSAKLVNPKTVRLFPK